MLIRADFTCSEVPEPIEYAVLRPNESGDPALPLLLLLHGGGQSREYLDRVRPTLQRAWTEGTLPPLLVATPSLPQRALYMNFLDGSERWEDALLGPFLERVRARHGASAERQRTLVCGPALGGMASLRFAFKHPQLFAGVAALEPSVEPVLDYDQIQPRDRFWRNERLLQPAYGTPIDGALWRANHPTAIAHDGADALRAAQLAIYLECGDEDSFGLYRGVEYLHRVLFDRRIAHEYRLVRGADHLGATMPGRFLDAMRFLMRVLNPPPPDPHVAELREYVRKLKQTVGVLDE